MQTLDYFSCQIDLQIPSQSLGKRCTMHTYRATWLVVSWVRREREVSCADVCVSVS